MGSQMRADAAPFVPSFLRQGKEEERGINCNAPRAAGSVSNVTRQPVSGSRHQAQKSEHQQAAQQHCVPPDGELQFDDLFDRQSAMASNGMPTYLVHAPHTTNSAVVVVQRRDVDDVLADVSDAVSKLTLPRVETVGKHRFTEERDDGLLVGAMHEQDSIVSEPLRRSGGNDTSNPSHSSAMTTPAKPPVDDGERRVVRCGSVDVGHDGVVDSTELASSGNACLADFELLKVIGRGAFGKVYLVRSKRHPDRTFAMKVLQKGYMIRTKNVKETKIERSILTRVRHPFSVSLHYAFQDERALHLVMDYCAGGQLFFHLREQAMLAEESVKFYVAELVLAIEHLHALGIIHRDLKPENVLLRGDGHICLTDYGFAKEDMIRSDEDTEAGGQHKSMHRSTNSFCGTLCYMAPEMVSGKGHSVEADWWSLGILAYDMLTGNPPWFSKNEGVLCKKILNDKLRFPAYLSAEVISLLKGLINRTVEKRLGSYAMGGPAALKRHPFFKSINWGKLLAKDVAPPFLPKLDHSLDTRNFDTEYTTQALVHTPSSPLSKSQDALFHGFSWVRSPA